MHLQYNIHRIRPSKFRPQNDPNTHTPKTNSEYCIFRDKCILRIFYSFRVHGDREKLRAWRSKIVWFQRTQREIKSVTLP